MNTGQQAKRFIHTTVARDKVLVRSRIYNKQAVRIVTDFCMDMLRPSGCSKNHDLVFIFSDGLTCLPRLPFNIFPSYNRIGRQICSFPLFSQRFGKL